MHPVTVVLLLYASWMPDAPPRRTMRILGLLGLIIALTGCGGASPGEPSSGEGSASSLSSASAAPSAGPSPAATASPVPSPDASPSPSATPGPSPDPGAAGLETTAAFTASDVRDTFTGEISGRFRHHSTQPSIKLAEGTRLQIDAEGSVTWGGAGIAGPDGAGAAWGLYAQLDEQPPFKVGASAIVEIRGGATVVNGVLAPSQGSRAASLDPAREHTLTFVIPDGSSPEETSAGAYADNSGSFRIQVRRLGTGTFFDPFEGEISSLWTPADGWANGNPFNCGWRSDHVEFSDGLMSLRLDDQPCGPDPGGCSDRPYASAEYRSDRSCGFGTFGGALRAASGSGLVTSLFVYTGPSEGNPHDEIDIEILGRDPRKLQLNYFTNGVGGHETVIDLGFDASEGFHHYAFEWSATRIRWFVDGIQVHIEDGSRGPLPAHPGRLMVNFWPGVGVDGWLGPFNYSGSALRASYDWVHFTAAQ